MTTSFFKCPPLDKLSTEDAIKALAIGPNKRDLKSEFGNDANIEELARFIKELESGRLLSFSWDLAVFADGVTFTWFFHPQHKSGVLLALPDDEPETSPWVELQAMSSEELGDKLCSLLRDNYPLEHVESCQVDYFQRQGLNKKDLVAAVAQGIFAGHSSDPVKAAKDWLEADEPEE